MYTVQYRLFFSVGAIALAEFVAESKMLEQLDLRDNDIRIAGLMALSLAHKMNYKLVRLSMPRTIKIEPVSKACKPLKCVLQGDMVFVHIVTCWREDVGEFES